MSTPPTAVPAPAAGKASLWRRFRQTVRGFLLWRHERGSWQYDVMVVLILLFVFGTPRAWFRDLPLTPVGVGMEIRVLQKSGDTTRYRIPANLLWQYGDSPEAGARVLLAPRHSKPFTITGIVPVEDDAGAIVWYDVWVREPRD